MLYLTCRDGQTESILSGDRRLEDTVPVVLGLPLVNVD